MLDQIPDRELRTHLGALHWVGWCEHHLERYGDVLRHYEHGLVLGRSTGQRHLLIPMLLGFVITHTWMGDLAAASDEARAAAETAQLVGSEQLIALTLALRCWLAVRIGDVPPAIATAAAYLAKSPQSEGPHALLTRAWLGEAQIESGAPAAGRRLVMAAGGGPELGAIEPSQRAYFCELLTRAELALGARQEAQRWARLAEESAAALGLCGPRTWARRAQAQLAIAGGDFDAGAELALASVAAAGTTHPLERQRSRLLAGTALAAAGNDSALDVLGEAHACLRQFGAHRLEALAARQLRALGRYVGQPRRHGESENELAILSARELEVATLVAEHLTNREIAEQLILSPKTIERHMEHIFNKLGLSSRGAVARYMLSAPQHTR